MIVIGHGFDDSYLGLGITRLLLSFCMLSLYFLLALLRD